MFGFLNSFVLPALAAAAVPLIIHFFYKRRTKTVLFSSIRFLKLLESKRIKYLRIYQLLLVLLRMLFILALVAAFARPVIKSSFLSDASANTTVVILLDDSYSMRTFTSVSDYFQEAKQSVKTILKTFSEKDKVFLLLPSQINPLMAPDLDFINALNPGFSRVDFHSAFKQVLHIFKEHINYNRELYLISDFRINKKLFPDSLEALLAAENIRLFLLNPGQNLTFKNTGIDTVIVNSQIIEQNKPFSISVHVQNHNAREEQETRIHLFEGQKRLAMNTVTLPAGSGVDVSLSVLPEHAGTLPLHLELDSDDLSIDNFYYLNVSVAGKLRFLFVGTPKTEPLSAALNTLREQSQLQITILPFGRLKGADLNRFDAVLLCDPPPLDNNILYRLKRFNASGHSLILLPGEKTNLQTLNTLLHSVTGQRPFLPIKTIPRGEGYFSTEEGFGNNALFRPLFISQKKKIPAPEIYRFYPLRPGGNTLIRLRNGFPLLTSYSGETKSGKLYVFSSALDLKWNNLPLQGFFVPLLQRLFYRAGQPEESALMSLSDRTLVLHLPGYSLHDRYELKTPSAEILPLNPSMEDNGVYISIKAPLQPGQYQVLKNSQPVKLFSVNISADELRRPYYRFDTSSPSVFELKNDAYLTEKIKETRSGFELWPIFATIAFLLLLLEIILIKRIEGNNERTSD